MLRGTLGRLAEQLADLGGAPSALGAIVLCGQRFPVYGAQVVTFLDDAACAPEVTEGGERPGAIQAIVLHTHTGEPRDPALLEQPGRPSVACALARYQTTTEREVSWDFTVASTGVILQQNDPCRRYTWQANQVNRHTVGIELEQGPGGTLVREQLDVAVALCDTLTRALGIQRQLPATLGPRGGRVPDRRVLGRFSEEGGAGAGWWGILGHRNVTTNRGPGDPGDPVMQRLLEAGYEGWDLARGEDLAAWAGRQRAMGVGASGEPDGPTVAALRARGFPEGVMVPRPGDRA
jgi:hypothetical protein